MTAVLSPAACALYPPTARSGSRIPASGPIVAIYNGQRYEGNPRDIPLNAHAQIQLEVGSPLIAPESVSFPSGL